MASSRPGIAWGDRVQVPILSGIYADARARFRVRYPRNLVPVPQAQGISAGYLAPADGIATFGAGPGLDRGGINWDGVCYRVMGTKLVRVEESGAVNVLGDVGGGGAVTMDYGFDALAIWSGGRLYYWDGDLRRVSDPDLGTVIDGKWFAGYYVSTDGVSIVVTDLGDKFSVNPLKYGSSEADPDPVLAIDELRNEVYSLGRYTIEAFQNVGGSGFPLQRIDGAHVPVGIVGTHAYAQFLQTFAFVGSARNEPPAVYLMAPGSAQQISTSEIDQILATLTDDELAALLVETRVDKGHRHLLVHTPTQTLVYDAAASSSAREPVWFTLDSGDLGGPRAYRARGLVWCYGRWLCGDTESSSVGALTADTADHYGAKIGWDFGTPVVYNGGRGAIVHQVELVALTGGVPLGVDPVVWSSYSTDGQTWGVERPRKAGQAGERDKRLIWRNCGMLRNWRVQRFRGTSDARLSFARLEVQVEALNA